jgi:hypothetical protein
MNISTKNFNIKKEIGLIPPHGMFAAAKKIVFLIKKIKNSR